MKLANFLLDEWLNQRHGRSIQYDLAASTGPEWTLRELFELVDDKSKELVFDTHIDYSDAKGDHRLREEIANFSGVRAQDVQIFTGGSEALLILFFLAAEPNANVVLPFPSFPPFTEVAKSFGLEIRHYHLRPENQFRVSTSEVRALTDHNTKLILVNSPHNPCGSVMSDEELKELHDFAVERKVKFIVDEVYHPLYLGGTPRQTAAHLPHAVILSDLSKSLCFSGLRIGWLIERDHHKLEEYLNARSYFTVSNSPLTEILATFVVQNAKTVLSRANEVIRRNMEVLDAFFAENRQHLGWVRPQGGTIGFPWLLSGQSTRPLCEAMRDQGVFLVPGDCFGMPSHFRVGFGAYDGDIRPALQRIQAYLRK